MKIDPPADHRTRVAAERRARMRDHLLQAGLLLAAEKGPEGFSIDDLVQRAEVARGTFYKYFATPAELVRAVAIALSEELIETVQPLVGGIEDPARRMALGFRAVLGWVVAAPVVGAFITRSGWPHAAPGHAFFRIVVPNLDSGLTSGRFHLAHRSIGLALLGGLAIGAMQSLATEALPEDFAKMTAETLLKALGLPPDEAALLARESFVPPPPQANGLIARALAERV